MIAKYVTITSFFTEINPYPPQVLKELEFFHPHHVCYSFWGPYELPKV